MSATALPALGVLLAVGCLCLLGRSAVGKWLRKIGGHFITTRGGGIAFLAAGLIVSGLGGASLLRWVTVHVDRWCASVGWWELGTPILTLVAVFAAGYWVMAMLPDGMFAIDPPDPVLVLGVVIPSLVAGVPGGIGNALVEMFAALGGTVVDGARESVKES